MTTLCTSNDPRNYGGLYPVARKLVTVTIVDEATSGTSTAPINGRILAIIADVPALTGSSTIAIDIQDEDGTNLFAQKASLAESTKTRWDLQAAATPHGAVCCGTVTFKCTGSEAQTDGDKVINLIAYYI